MRDPKDGGKTRVARKIISKETRHFLTNPFLPITAHPLRRPRRCRNRFPRQAEDLGQVTADRGHDNVQRLDLLARAGSAALQGHGPDHAAGRCGAYWWLGGVGRGKQGQDCDEVRGGSHLRWRVRTESGSRAVDPIERCLFGCVYYVYI